MTAPLLVLDATSPIGSALVATALRDGRAVLAASLDYAGLRALKAEHRKADLQLLPGSAADPAAAEALVAELRELDRPLGGVVLAGCCEPTRGRLLDQDEASQEAMLRAELLPQFAAARALVPLLAEGGRNGRYLVIGGPGGEQPWAGYGLRSIATATTRMLLRVLHDEARAMSVRVQLLAVEMPARTDDNQARACSHWPTALAIAERAYALVDPTRLREPAEAVVRFAWNALPTPPDRRAVHATASTPRLLDDTWLALKPILDAATPSAENNNKD